MSFDGRGTQSGPHNEFKIACWEAQKAAERKAWNRIKPPSWDPYEANLECERAFKRDVEPHFLRDEETLEPSPAVGYVAFVACYRSAKEVWAWYIETILNWRSPMGDESP